MTHAEMIREYTRSYKNMLSTSAEKRLAQLEAEAAKEGLRFQMINERQWMLPHFMGDPHFELIALESEGGTEHAIREWIHENRPGLDELYYEIYNKKSRDYWTALDQRIREYTEKEGMPYLRDDDRMLFPTMHYEDDNTHDELLPIKKKCGLIVTGNATTMHIKMGGGAAFKNTAKMISMIFGSCETLYACDTYQFTDYRRYYAGMFNEAHKAEVRDKQFPFDLQNAYELGKRLCQ